MKRLITTLGVCLAIGVGAAAQQQQQQQQQPDPQSQKPATQEVTLTGCLVQGSVPTVFLFDNAKKDPANKEEKGVKYFVVVGTEDLNLRNHLNHEVRIVGIWDGKVAPATGKVEEKDLPRFTAKSVTMVADTCTASVR